MHVDGTVARVNGNNNHVVVCSNGMATMYFASGRRIFLNPAAKYDIL